MIFLAAVGLAAALDAPLRATLLGMARDDQESIRITAGDPSRAPSAAEQARARELDGRNAELIRKIVREHGWPGIALVGEDGSSAAWLVVQHQDNDVDFQRSCLALMKEAFASGDVLPHDFAYLTDRVLTHEGKPQMYGTQGIGVSSPADEARVNANRAAIGLPLWKVAVEERRRVYANGYGGGGTDLTMAQVKSAEACLPDLGDGPPHVVRFENGRTEAPGIRYAEMRATALGRLGGEPVAIVEIVWNTGGSGNWEIVARFARVNGVIVCRGIYSPAPDLPDGGTMVEKIEICDERVYLYGADPLHHRSIAKPLVVTGDVFEPCGR